MKAEGEGDTEDEMVGWHHQLNEHEFEQTLGDREGQGSLASCSSWGRKKSDTTFVTEQAPPPHPPVFLFSLLLHQHLKLFLKPSPPKTKLLCQVYDRPLYPKQYALSRFITVASQN